MPRRRWSQELDAACQATGTEIATCSALMLAAWCGREQEFGELNEAALREVAGRGEELGMLVVHRARAVLANGLGR